MSDNSKGLHDLGVMILYYINLFDGQAQDALEVAASEFGPNVVDAIRTRINDSNFGDDESPADPAAAMNALYTLYGDPNDPLGRRFEMDAEGNRTLRANVYGDSDSQYNKVAFTGSLKPLIETGRYEEGFDFEVKRGNLWVDIDITNSEGMRIASDTGRPLWETLEFGATFIPARPHVMPGMRDAWKQFAFKAGEIVAAEVKSQLRHALR